MYIFQYLNGENEKVDGLLKEMRESDSPLQRESLFHEIQNEMALHSESEESKFYSESARCNYMNKKTKRAKQAHSEINFVWTL